MKTHYDSGVHSAKRNLQGRIAALAAAGFMALAPVTGAQMFFDSASSGTTWNTVLANWSNASGGPYTSTWVNDSEAVFETSVGSSIAIGAGVSASGITNNTISGDHRLNNALTLTGAAPIINTGSGAGTLRIDANLTSVNGFQKTGARNLNLRGNQSGVTGIISVTGGGVLLTGVAAQTQNAAWSLGSGTTLQSQFSGTHQLGSLSGVAGATLNSGSSAISTYQIGALGTTTAFSGNIVNGSGSARVAIEKVGGGTLTLAGANTYTLNTTVSAGSLTLANGGQTRFSIQNSNISNSILGTGIVQLDGQFVLDISTVTDTSGTWNLVNIGTLSETFGGTFGLQFVAGPSFSPQGGGVYTSGNWTFQQSTGNLSLVPEPQAAVLLAVFTAFLGIRRRVRAHEPA